MGVALERGGLAGYTRRAKPEHSGSILPALNPGTVEPVLIASIAVGDCRGAFAVPATLGNAKRRLERRLGYPLEDAERQLAAHPATATCLLGRRGAISSLPSAINSLQWS
jgi:hypothetical protein